MPFDPTPVGGALSDDALTVQIQGGDGEPETVLVIGRPCDGRVAVRELPAPGTPSAYDAPADAVYERLARALRAGRRVSAELQLVRQWLDGHR